jgi:hypothetical protein
VQHDFLFNAKVTKQRMPKSLQKVIPQQLSLFAMDPRVDDMESSTAIGSGTFAPLQFLGGPELG